MMSCRAERQFFGGDAVGMCRVGELVCLLPLGILTFAIGDTHPFRWSWGGAFLEAQPKGEVSGWRDYHGVACLRLNILIFPP